MRKISDAVSRQVHSSLEPYVALRDGYMNMSAYAQTIRDDIEDRTSKEVHSGSIVVTLARLRKKLRQEHPLLPELHMQDISARSNLVEMTFDRTDATLRCLKDLYRNLPTHASDFLAVTQGARELCIVTSEAGMQTLQKHFAGQKPKLHLRNLAALTMSFDGKHIQTPNMLFAILRMLVIPRINVVEIISTYSEVTFIVDASDLEEAFSIFSSILYTNRSSPQSRSV